MSVMLIQLALRLMQFSCVWIFDVKTNVVYFTLVFTVERRDK